MSDDEARDAKPSMLGARALTGVVKVERFDGSGDVDRFLAHFDVVAKANAWSPDVQFLQLPASLTGNAFDFFRRLPEAECKDIGGLKKALRAEYDAQALETDYALLFAARKRMAGEGMVEYSEALRSLGRKAYPTFSDSQLEILCKSHFINGVDEALRVQLLVSGAKEDETYRQLVGRARQLEQVMAPSRVRRLQDPPLQEAGSCQDQDEIKEDLKKLTSVVSSLEKKVSELSTRTRPKTFQRGPPGPCPNCGQTGHWRRDCTSGKTASDPGVEQKGKTVYCFKCQRPGHFARGCAHFV